MLIYPSILPSPAPRPSPPPPANYVPPNPRTDNDNDNDDDDDYDYDYDYDDLTHSGIPFGFFSVLVVFVFVSDEVVLPYCRPYLFRYSVRGFFFRVGRICIRTGRGRIALISYEIPTFVRRRSSSLNR